MGRFKRRSLDKSAWAELSHSPGGAQPAVRSQGTLSLLQRPLVPKSVMTQGSRLRGRFGLGVLARLWERRPTRDPGSYPGAGRRSRARTRRCGGSSGSPRSSGTRRCRRSAAEPSGCRAPRPPGPCLRERKRAARQREQGRIHTFHLVPLALQHHQPQTTQTPPPGRSARMNHSGHWDSGTPKFPLTLPVLALKHPRRFCWVFFSLSLNN